MKLEDYFLCCFLHLNNIRQTPFNGIIKYQILVLKAFLYNIICLSVKHWKFRNPSKSINRIENKLKAHQFIFRQQTVHWPLRHCWLLLGMTICSDSERRNKEQSQVNGQTWDDHTAAAPLHYYTMASMGSCNFGDPEEISQASESELF
jgi:hypothetical protein